MQPLSTRTVYPALSRPDFLSRWPTAGDGPHGRLRHAAGTGSLVAAERSAAGGAAQPRVAHRDRHRRAYRGRRLALPRAVADDGRRVHVGLGAIGQPLGADLRAAAAAEKEGDLDASTNSVS